MAAELGYDVRPTPARPAPPPLRLALPPRPARSPSRREVVYALALGLVLGVGVLGVLVLNTLMQQQARTIATQQAALGALALEQQTLQLRLDATDNPRALARRAAALHMRPAGFLLPLRPAPPDISARPHSSTRPRGSARPHSGTPPHGSARTEFSGRGRGTQPNRAG
jgi:hypothetical protein